MRRRCVSGRAALCHTAGDQDVPGLRGIPLERGRGDWSACVASPAGEALILHARMRSRPAHSETRARSVPQRVRGAGWRSIATTGCPLWTMLSSWPRPRPRPCTWPRSRSSKPARFGPRTAASTSTPSVAGTRRCCIASPATARRSRGFPSTSGRSGSTTRTFTSTITSDTWPCRAPGAWRSSRGWPHV